MKFIQNLVQTLEAYIGSKIKKRQNNEQWNLQKICVEITSQRVFIQYSWGKI